MADNKLLRGDAVFDQIAENAARMALERTDVFAGLAHSLNKIAGKNTTEAEHEEHSRAMVCLLNGDPVAFDLLVRMANLGCVYTSARILNRPVAK